MDAEEQVRPKATRVFNVVGLIRIIEGERLPVIWRGLSYPLVVALITPLANLTISLYLQSPLSCQYDLFLGNELVRQQRLTLRYNRFKVVGTTSYYSY